MRIAFVSQLFDSALPPGQNSIGLWTYHVARRLGATHAVTVYQRHPGGTVELPGDPITWRLVRTLPGRLQSAPSRAHHLLLRAARGPAAQPPFALASHSLDYGLQVALDLRRRGVDIVHVQNFSQLVRPIRALNPHAKIVLHMHCEWLSQLDRKLIEARLRQVDLVVGCSEHITGLVRQRFPALAPRCRSLYNGFDETIFAGEGSSAPAGPPRLVFVGRISPEKGVHALLDAFRQIAPRFPEAILDIVGPYGVVPREFIVGLSDDPHVRALERFYDGQGYQAHLQTRIPAELADRIRFQGWKSQAETVPFYRGARALVNPSLSESFGMSILEAATCGVPAVVARTGGMKETVLHGKTGLVVEPGDAAALAGALAEMLTDTGRARQMGEAARTLIGRRYSWDTIASDVLDAYGELQVGPPQEMSLYA